MKNIILICLFLPVALLTHAQDSTTLPKKLSVYGYITSLETLTFDKNFKDLISGNLLHNRINIKWAPAPSFKVVAEFRNRVFWGEEAKATPGFASLLRNENELLDLQKAWINNKSLVLHTNTERLYVDYQVNEMNVRIGRQRINWGVTTTWNPNDIFNTYNFLDFDYEERPGIDGGKLKYIFSNTFNTELAYANTGKRDGDVAALKYTLYKWNYDMQLITGWYKAHPTVGAGWAGYIKDAGFKGEIQYFFAKKDSAGHLNISLEGDYMYKKGWYVNLGLLFNKNGMYKPPDFGNSLNLKLSPESPMPTKWNIILTTAKEFTPLLSATMSVIYAPGTNLLIVFPKLQYNMAANLDVSLIWQSFFAGAHNRFEALDHRCYLRIKWSF